MRVLEKAGFPVVGSYPKNRQNRFVRDWSIRYERYWRRITEAREQTDFPHDLDRMRTLAAQILDADAIYPWTRGALKNADIDEESRKRLESVGWLRRLEDGRVEIWHNRLLTDAAQEDASQVSAAIRGLAKFDPDAAFRAALLALDQFHLNKEILPSLLIE